MGELSEKRREDVWYALSHVFANEYFDYRKFSGIEIEELEKIFFDEAALHCGPDFLIATPQTGEGFSREDMIIDIREKLKRGNNSIFIRLINRIFSAFYRHFFRDTWESFSENLKIYRKLHREKGK